MGTFFCIICSFLFFWALTEILFGNWWIVLIVIGVIILSFIILSIVISERRNDKAIDTYHKEIDEVARIYADFYKVAQSLDGYVVIGTNELYIRLDNCAPNDVREYYEGRWSCSFPYDEDFWKADCLKHFNSCKYVDKELLWNCILNRIISKNYENWGNHGEWAFEYPIFCPPEFTDDEFQRTVKSWAEKYIKGDTEAETDKPASQTASPTPQKTDTTKPTPNGKIKKSIKCNDGTFCTAVNSEGLRKFFYSIGMYRQAVITDNINKKSYNLDEMAWFSKDNHYRYDITYSKTLKKWLIKFNAYKSCYVMLDEKGEEITWMSLPSGFTVTHIKILNTDTQKIEQDFNISVT